MTKYLYIFISIMILSCQTESQVNVNADSQESIPNIDKTGLTQNSKNPKYPFVEELKSRGFGTDTNRLNQLADYAYKDLRMIPFQIDGNALVSNLNIKSSRVLEYQKFDNNDSLFINSVSNGKGFYFVQVDSNGIGTKNSFDFGMEIWDYRDTDTLLLVQSWKDIYHPMPLYINISNDQLHVFYTRRSNDYKHLIEIKNEILKVPNTK